MWGVSEGWQCPFPLSPVPELGIQLRLIMHIIAKASLREFWSRYPMAERPLRLWYSQVQAADWSGPADVKAMFGTSVDFIADNRLIFDIGGNKFRLIVYVAYRHHRVLVKFIGTHGDYDRLDLERL